MLVYVSLQKRVFLVMVKNSSSVIRQKGESQNEFFKKTKQQISVKRTFFTPWCTYQGVKNARFSENLACLVFLKHPFLRFALLPYYRRVITNSFNIWNHIGFSHSEAAVQRCYQKKLFWKYAANLHENTHAEV